MSTVVNSLAINGATGLTVSGIGTSLKYFPALGISLTQVNPNPGIVAVPGNNVSNGVRTTVRASGSFQVGDITGPCPTFTLGLYPVTFVGAVGTVVSTAILSTTSSTQANVAAGYPWALTADFIGDTGSGLVQCASGELVIDGNATAATAGLVTGLTGINFGASYPYGFCIGFSFSISEASNSATIFQFNILQ
jgi:hypothetical protein